MGKRDREIDRWIDRRASTEHTRGAVSFHFCKKPRHISTAVLYTARYVALPRLFYFWYTGINGYLLAPFNKLRARSNIDKNTKMKGRLRDVRRDPAGYDSHCEKWRVRDRRENCPPCTCVVKRFLGNTAFVLMWGPKSGFVS